MSRSETRTADPTAQADPGWDPSFDPGVEARRIGSQPPESVGPVRAVKHFYSRFARFSGRASRSEYWWIYLFSVIVGAAFSASMGAFDGGVVGGLADQDFEALSTPGRAWLVIGQIVALVHVIPGLAVLVRRLHDTNRSGWWVLLYLTVFAAIPMIAVPALTAAPAAALVLALVGLLIMLSGPLVLLIWTIFPSNPQGVRFDRADKGADKRAHKGWRKDGR